METEFKTAHKIRFVNTLVGKKFSWQNKPFCLPVNFTGKLRAYDMSAVWLDTKRIIAETHNHLWIKTI